MEIYIIKILTKLGAVVHICSGSYKGESRIGLLESRILRTVWATITRPCFEKQKPGAGGSCLPS
jgi:hypothetical protein